MAAQPSSAPVDSVEATLAEITRCMEPVLLKYYQVFDRLRNALTCYYGDSVLLLWNGHTARGKTAALNFLWSLPPTTHAIAGLDCQPLTSPTTPLGTSILATVTGTVAYSSSHPRPFSQTFFFTRANPAVAESPYVIVSDCFRLSA